ncbi:hypothetical protein PBRA_007054 [Plasmodiophora brassicae]|uniref:Integrase catalytic domain-containing protein n=1 Tax=Plasmodiophora brassicae TaxID=37360 RepID=A0A0G4IUJ3_PLABS|nr:hypothetical protein PBRA_007054 [Plasmodiophora brassicae]
MHAPATWAKATCASWTNVVVARSSTGPFRSFKIDAHALPAYSLKARGPHFLGAHVGDLVHSDLSGRWPVIGIDGFEYYQTMLDDSSRYLSVYLLRRKSDALDVIKHYDARLRNQEGRGIGTFQTDGGGEFNSKACVLFYNESGILHRKSVPYTPEQNGRAERVNYTLCCIELSIRCHARMPDVTWPWSLTYSAIMYNIHPRSVVPGRRTSFEAARRALPDVSALRERDAQSAGTTVNLKRRNQSEIY